MLHCDSNLQGTVGCGINANMIDGNNRSLFHPYTMGQTAVQHPFHQIAAGQVFSSPGSVVHQHSDDVFVVLSDGNGGIHLKRQIAVIRAAYIFAVDKNTGRAANAVKVQNSTGIGFAVASVAGTEPALAFVVGQSVLIGLPGRVAFHIRPAAVVIFRAGPTGAFAVTGLVQSKFPVFQFSRRA